MPSNKKKQSKSASRLSSSDPSASPQTLSPACLDVELSEQGLVDSLDEASKRFPCLIGKSVVVGRVNDIDPEVRGCKVWLSEPFMVASSITPGSIVSVSLASPRNQSFQRFPLSSFSGEYARNKGVDLGDNMANHAGNYFALAKAFPSSKLLKNGVRLSSNLWYTMGCPAPTRIIFIYHVEQMSHGLIKGTNKLSVNDDSHFSLQQCSELYLEVASAEELAMKSTVMSLMNSSSGKSHNINDNGVLSPKTPVYSKMIPSGTHKLSPATYQKKLSSAVSEASESSQAKEMSLGADSSVITALLEDENSKILLQGCTLSWLCFRILLQGNLVMVPMLSKLCIFMVVGGKKMLSSRTNQNNTSEIRQDSSQETSDSLDMKSQVFVMTRETKVSLCLPPNMRSDTSVEKGPSIGKPMNGSIKLGGLHKEYTLLKNIIMSSMVKHTMSRFGLRPIKGVILHGPPGTGKTSMARLCAQDAGVSFFCINGSEVFRQYYGESEQALREVFDSAGRSAPAVVFIDELDAIAPAREDGGEELSQRMVVTLLSLMDGITRTDGLLVIAATNRLDSLEPALRRHGRFDKEIELGVPSPKQRLEILSILLGQLEHCLSDMQVQQLAAVTHGFVGADLAALCEEAAISCLRRYNKLKKSNENSHDGSLVKFGGHSDVILEDLISEDIGDLQLEHLSSASSSTLEDGGCASSQGLSRFESVILTVSFEDFEKAKEKVKPSAMREVILEVPKVKWEDVGGQKEVKHQLMEAIEWPQKHQDALDRIGTRPPKGVLMFGPPGCSKTLMARAVASEAGLNFLAVKGPQLFSKWVGESEKAVRAIFAKARANAPSIIFFDEIDGLAVIRGKESDGVSVSDRVMSQLLIEMDGLHQRVGVTIIGATNRPDKIDSALLRPGRFDRLLFVGPPTETDRQEIFSIHLRKIPCSSDVNINELAWLTNGFTGADISFVCREAGIAAMNEDLEASEVSMRHFRTAIELVQPSEIHSYQELSIKFQRLVQSIANNN